MTPRRTYFGPTTPQQRHVLFTIWQQTGCVTTACTVARVGRRTFYYWKPRFDALGFAGVAAPRSSAPHQPQQTDPAIATQVIALRQAHPTWGKRRIAAEIAKASSWQVQLSPNTVRRILHAAALWPTPLTPKKRIPPASVPPTSLDKP
jgi:transposase